MLAPDVGDDGTAEIERFHPFVEDDFGRVGVEERLLEVAVRVEGLGERGDLCRGVVEASLQGLDLFGMDEGLVALDIDDDIEALAHFLVGLLATIGPAPVLVGGEDRLAAKGLDGFQDACVVGRDAYGVERAADLLVHSLDHGFAQKIGQRLARKAGRGVAGRDDSDKFHVCACF